MHIEHTWIHYKIIADTILDSITLNSLYQALVQSEPTLRQRIILDCGEEESYVQSITFPLN